MTTIVYRGGVLASDSTTTAGDTNASYARKISRIGPVMFASSGCAMMCQEFMDWIRRGLKGHQPVMDAGPPGPEARFAYGVLILPDSDTVLRFVPEGGALALYGPYFVEGSGRDVALGALHQGATAEQAVQAALRHDAYSKGPLQRVRRACASINRFPTMRFSDGFSYPYE